MDMIATGSALFAIELDDAHARAMAATSPLLGVEARTDADGQIQPWCAVLAFPGEYEKAVRYMMAMPDKVYVSPPYDDVHGDLISLQPSVQEQAAAIADALTARGASSVIVAMPNERTSLVRLLAERGIAVHCVDTWVPWDEARLEDPFGIGGWPGHEIAQLADPDRREYNVWFEKDGQFEWDPDAATH